MDSDDGDEAALPLGRSVVGTTPGAAKLSVKGMYNILIRGLSVRWYYK